MIKALWGMDYDFHTDRCYQRPLCPECNAPIYLKGDRFYCISCGSEMEVTKDMADWIKKREKVITKTKDCQQLKLGDCVLGCGGKRPLKFITSRTLLRLNGSTLGVIAPSVDAT